MEKSHSQSGQENWVLQILKEKRDGFFIEIGAHDGDNISNTFLLEKEYGWNGLLIEPNPETFAELVNNRKSICVNKAVSNFTGRGHFILNRELGKIDSQGTAEVDIITFRELFTQHNIPEVIDYFSLDIEGGEYKALLGFPFEKHKFMCLTVEHNLYMKDETPEVIKNKNNIYSILSAYHYIRIKENIENSEDWYVHSDLLLLK